MSKPSPRDNRAQHDALCARINQQEGEPMKDSIELIFSSAPAAVYVFTFIFGAVIGSFLNVCIYRLPKHESIVVVPSHCMSCGRKLMWYELVPLFSFLFLRGKCHGCKAKISPQYFIVEFITGLLFVLVLFVKGITADTILIQLLISALLVIGVIDARTFEIPFPVVVFIGILGAIRIAVNYKTFTANWWNIVFGPIAMMVLFGLIIFISNGRAMGGGDYKLAIAAGLFLGLKQVALGLVLGCVIGSVIHVILMIVKKKGRELAFGPYLGAGFALSALWGNEMISWYVTKFLTF